MSTVEDKFTLTYFSGAGVPCVPGYHGENQDPAFLYEKAQEIGINLPTTSLSINVSWSNQGFQS